jgi:hypothetical protein
MGSMATSSIMALPGGRCPNPNCGQDIGDWHTEWLQPPGQTEVYAGRAAIDRPRRGAWVMLRGGIPSGLAPPGTPHLKRSMARARFWAGRAQVTPVDLDDYLSRPPGSIDKDYDFDP